MIEALPLPTAGSVPQLSLLYCPPHSRAGFAALLAVRGEIRRCAREGLDAAVAYARLGWWREELQRLADGRPAHPFAQALARAMGPRIRELARLAGWVDAAAMHVAHTPLGDPGLRRRYCEAASGPLFAVGGALLGASELSAGPLWDLASRLHQIELAARIDRAEADRELLAADLRSDVLALGAAAQPTLRALLVWTALVAWRAARDIRIEAEAPPPRARDALAQNLVAWRAARAAARGRFDPAY